MSPLLRGRRMLRASEVAELLGVTRDAVYKARERGTLHAVDKNAGRDDKPRPSWRFPASQFRGRQTRI